LTILLGRVRFLLDRELLIGHDQRAKINCPLIGMSG